MFHENDEFTKNRFKKFEVFAQEIEDFYRPLVDKYDSLLEDAHNNTEYIKYGIGCYLMHRGYFCPNPVRELIVGNNKRGQLVDKKAPNTNTFYEYYFDKHQNLICSKRYEKNILCDVEFIIKIMNKNYSLNFNVSKTTARKYEIITFVSVCTYNKENNIVSYIKANISRKMEKHTFIYFLSSLDSEFFNYKNNNLIESIDFSYGTYFGNINSTLIFEEINKYSNIRRIDFSESSYREDRMEFHYDDLGNIVDTIVTTLSRHIDPNFIKKLEDYLL